MLLPLIALAASIVAVAATFLPVGKVRVVRKARVVGPVTAQVRCKGFWRVKVVYPLALAALALRLIDEARVASWVNAALARCRAQVRVGGGRWVDRGPIDVRVTLTRETA